MQRALQGVAGLLPAIFLFSSAACGQETFAPAQGLRLETVATDLENPVWLTAPRGDPRLFVVEQRGWIRIVSNGRVLPRPFLDLTDRVRFGGERGLLSVAFHPRYPADPRLFVNYTDLHGDTRIESYLVSTDPDRADPASARLVLTVAQPYANHNGGLVMFGPDGMLYVGMGDGGSGGDPQGHAQNRADLLGDLLRIDVDQGEPYAIPPDNPFARRPGVRPEIWAFGLRNPWRFCFDPPSGMLYIADVGQNRWEEIDVQPARSAGLNYGWNRMEGRHCYGGGCDTAGLALPLVEYGHSEGCSVTGGFVYRGRRMPELVGHYFFADYCSGFVRSFRLDHGRATQARAWELGNVGDVTSFGQDSEGELYVLTMQGRVLRIAPRGGSRG